MKAIRETVGISLGIIAVMCLLTWAATAGMRLFNGGETPREQSERLQSERAPIQTDFGRGEFLTVEHDGHKFVVLTYSGNPTFQHHPSCPCK